jgi:hypothetical protein
MTVISKVISTASIFMISFFNASTQCADESSKKKSPKNELLK